MVLCNASESQDTYGGYQVELFRRMATAIGWTKDDFYLRCMVGVQGPTGMGLKACGMRCTVEHQ